VYVIFSALQIKNWVHLNVKLFHKLNQRVNDTATAWRVGWCRLTTHDSQNTSRRPYLTVLTCYTKVATPHDTIMRLSTTIAR